MTSKSVTPPKKPKKRKASIEINAQEASIAEARKRVDSSYCHAGLLDRMPDALLAATLAQLPSTLCDPYMIRSSCRKLQSLYDREAGVWQYYFVDRHVTIPSELTARVARNMVASELRTNIWDFFTACGLVSELASYEEASRATAAFRGFHRSWCRVLDLHGEDVESLPPSLGTLQAIVTLNLSGCAVLQRLPPEIGKLCLLQELLLEGCKSLTDLPQELQQLSLSLTLDLRGCENLRRFPREIGTLQELLLRAVLPGERAKSLAKSGYSRLDLHGGGNGVEKLCAGMKILPSEIGCLGPTLRELNIERCSSLTALPREVGKLTALHDLNMQGCAGLVELPPEIGNLRRLVELNLDRCGGLVRLPREIGALRSLQRLDLRRCTALIRLPTEIGELMELQSLKLSGCRALGALPDTIGGLRRLTRLSLTQCTSLMSLPAGVGQLQALTRLDMFEATCLLFLPPEIGQLQSLERLDLGGCTSLMRLPAEIRGLTGLLELSLDHCSAILSLPVELGQLQKLQRLNLRNCTGLSRLPHEMAGMAELVTLDLQDCSELEALPRDIGSIENLKTLDLRGCWKVNLHDIRMPNRRRKRGNAAAGDTGFGNWLLPGDVGPQLGRVACASP